MSTTRSIQVKFTRDYDMFEMDPLNRDLHGDKRLVESFKTYGPLPEAPIICHENGSGKLHVDEGHNRLAVARDLDTGIWYMVVRPKRSLFDREAPTTSRWSVNDFCTAYAKAGNEQYVKLLHFAREHSLSPTVAAALLTGQSENVHKNLKRGVFTIKDMAFAESVVAMSDDLFSLGISFATSSSFVMALMRLAQLEDFYPDRLVHRASLDPLGLHKRTTFYDYLDEIEAFYNYGARTDARVPLAFLAKARAVQVQAEARERAARTRAKK